MDLSDITLKRRSRVAAGVTRKITFTAKSQLKGHSQIQLQFLMRYDA
jgi:hypothetical protein